MKIKSGKGSISIFVLIALLFYIGFLMLLYGGNLNKVQTISERAEAIKAIYSRNFNNIDDVYNRRLSQNDNMQPVINWPTKIITNVTDVKSTYEEFGPTGGKVEYVVSNQTFSSIKELVDNIIENSSYGTKSITATAYGNNGLVTTEEKNIDIIRGMKVTNEAELKTAFSTTGDLYVYIDKDIECADTISTSNINHNLDLNGHKISCTKTNETYKFITLGDNSELTILDSSSAKDGVISANMSESVLSDGTNRTRIVHCISNNTGKLTIESGKIEVNIDQRMLQNNYATTLNDTSYAIENGGTLTLKGGTISSNTYAQACTNMAVREAHASSVGINNWGTLNIEDATIISKAEATMIRGKLSTLFGKTYAYAYGILNTGTMNNSDNAKFDISAVANKYVTYYQDSETKEITDTIKST